MPKHARVAPASNKENSRRYPKFLKFTLSPRQHWNPRQEFISENLLSPRGNTELWGGGGMKLV